MPSIAAYTVFAFGFMTISCGISGLYDPTFSLQYLSLPAGAGPSVQASSLGAIATGAFYILAAFQENRAFFRLSLLTRALTITWAFSMGGGWTTLGVAEGIGALGTFCALVLWQ